jgi:oligopeptide transport system substrate-binding protein
VVEPELTEELPVATPSRRRRLVLGAVAVLAAAAMIARLVPVAPNPDHAAASSSDGTVTILAGEPQSLDPAHHGDLGSASYVSQLYESLTAIGPSLAIEPALAASWQVTDNGTKVTFTLRDGLVFSDGSPLKASDVVHSWRRLFDARDPSPLASLIADVKGARALLAGTTTDTSTLGVSAPDDRTVVVDLERGGGDLPAIVSGAPFSVVPPSAGDGEISPTPGTMVGSGAYTLDSVSDTTIVLKANSRYWAGKPAIDTVKMLTTINGASPVDSFVAGDLDLTLSSDGLLQLSPADAAWIAYDSQLGPSLRSDPSLSVVYYGFDTKKAPFNDVRVRKAFAEAVDWRRLAKLDEAGASAPATSIVPAGVPGAPQGDYLPPYDPAGARKLLADAGFAGGAGLPAVSFIGNGGGYDEAIVAMLEQNLGVTIDYATMDFAGYQQRLATDPPAIWSQSWVADYPGPNDFLGVLLGTGSTANQGGWSDQTFDAAITRATSAASSSDALAAYSTALRIVQDQAPVVPVSYGTAYSLVRSGLVGASQTGTGIVRLAGLAWASP